MRDDTLEQTRKLIAAGFTREQAEVLIDGRYSAPSRLLANLQDKGKLPRSQAEAILDFIWEQRVSFLPRSPKLAGFLLGLGVALMLCGLIFLVDVLPILNAVQALHK
jgi:hypothetical protein